MLARVQVTAAWIAFSVACAVAAPQRLTVAPEVRREDVPQICAAVRAVTAYRIRDITALISPKWPHHVDPNLVSVSTCCTSDITGDAFTLQKKNGQWRVIGNSSWIQ